jgi:hypothetical protein
MRALHISVLNNNGLTWDLGYTFIIFSETTSTSKENMTRMNLFTAFLALLCVARTTAQEIKVEEFPMKIEAEESCLQMSVTHAFNGDCCTIQDTADGGCVLIVIAGKCAVSTMTSLTVTDGLLRF